MLRATLFGRVSNLNSRQLITVQFPVKTVTRNVSTGECEPQPKNPPECPPKKRCWMDLYPVPCGSWKEEYDRKNAIYNRQLLIATGLFIFTSIVMNRIGWVKGYPEITLF